MANEKDFPLTGTIQDIIKIQAAPIREKWTIQQTRNPQSNELNKKTEILEGKDGKQANEISETNLNFPDLHNLTRKRILVTVTQLKRITDFQRQGKGNKTFDIIINEPMASYGTNKIEPITTVKDPFKFNPEALTNLNKLAKNKKTFEKLPPPKICPAYASLVSGFSPSRITNAIPNYALEENNPSKLPELKRKRVKSLLITKKYCRKQFTYELTLRKEHENLNNTVAANEQYINNNIIQENEKERWILLIENTEPILAAKKLIYNLEFLYQKHQKTSTQKIKTTSQQALNVLLDVSSFF